MRRQPTPSEIKTRPRQWERGRTDQKACSGQNDGEKPARRPEVLWPHPYLVEEYKREANQHHYEVKAGCRLATTASPVRATTSPSGER